MVESNEWSLSKSIHSLEEPNPTLSNLREHPEIILALAADSIIETNGQSYKVIKCLGTGGEGVVYLTLGPNNELFTIKFLHKHLSGPRVENAINALKNTPFAYSCNNLLTKGKINGHEYTFNYVIRKYIDGGILKTLPLGSQYSQERVATIERVIRSMLTDVLEPHATSEIVHRDLKPRNIILAEKAHAIDWETAVNSGWSMSQSQCSRIIGTPLHIPHEGFVLKGPVLAAYDMHSVLMWILFGLFCETGMDSSFHFPIQDATPFEITINLGNKDLHYWGKFKKELAQIAQKINISGFRTKTDEGAYETAEKLLKLFKRGTSTEPKRRCTIEEALTILN